jgi:hypothetical protein
VDNLELTLLAAVEEEWDLTIMLEQEHLDKVVPVS